MIAGQLWAHEDRFRPVVHRHIQLGLQGAHLRACIVSCLALGDFVLSHRQAQLGHGLVQQVDVVRFLVEGNRFEWVSHGFCSAFMGDNGLCLIFRPCHLRPEMLSKQILGVISFRDILNADSAYH